MARTVLTLVPKAFDATLNNLTAMTGGNSLAVGQNGADYLFLSNTNSWGDITSPVITSLSTPRKRNGNEQIQPVMFANGSDPLPALANSGTQSPTFTMEAGDQLYVDTSGSATAGVTATIASSRINAGFTYTFPVKPDLNTFWWFGSIKGGQFTMDITISDGSKPRQYMVVPYTTNVTVQAWFEATFRGTADQVTAGVTVTIKINRDTAPVAAGLINLRAVVLPPPVKSPRPKGMRLRWI